MNSPSITRDLSTQRISDAFTLVYGTESSERAIEIMRLAEGWSKFSFESLADVKVVEHLLTNVPGTFEMFKKLKPPVQAAVVRNRKHFDPVSVNMYLRARALLPDDRDRLAGIYKLSSVWARWKHTNSSSLVQASLLIERGVYNEVSMGLVVGKLIQIFGFEQMKEIIDRIYATSGNQKSGGRRTGVNMYDIDLISIAQNWDSIRSEPMEWTLELYKQEVKETFA